MTCDETPAPRPDRRRLTTALAVGAIAAVAACAPPAGQSTPAPTADPTGHLALSSPAPSAAVPSAPQRGGPYAHTTAADLSLVAGRAKPLVYVPNQLAGTVQVIDPATYTVIASHPVARSPEHVAPSHDLATLWVLPVALFDEVGVMVCGDGRA